MVANKITKVNKSLKLHRDSVMSDELSGYPVRSDLKVSREGADIMLAGSRFQSQQSHLWQVKNLSSSCYKGLIGLIRSESEL